MTNNDNLKLDVSSALKHLKAGYNLMSYIDSEKTQFSILKNGKISVKSELKGLTLDQYSFLDIYKDSIFYIDDSIYKEEEIDLEKDKEYYSKIQARQ